MLGCQQIVLSLPQFEQNILEFLFEQSNKLINCGIYNLRQAFFHFNTIKPNCAYELMEEMKNNIHYKILYSQVAQQVLHGVGESFRSFASLSSQFNAGEIASKPRLPKYRKKGGMAGITYPRQALKWDKKRKQIRLPLGREFKKEFDVHSLHIDLPENLKLEEIRELRMFHRNRCFYAEFVYKIPAPKATVDPKKALGIDPGLDNWLTCLSNVGTSFILDGRQIKSFNQFYNKQVATLKEGKPQGFWSKRLATITEKRNRQMRDGINKAARIVINHCLEYQIGTVVFGWNKGNKKEVELGKKNNQEFVQIPTARLKVRIEQLCELYGIQFVETEESYTSKASFLDNDPLPVFGDNPSREGWSASGKRTKRGLYRTANNRYINADANASANILKKVSTTLGLCLDGVCRGSLTTPLRVYLWQIGPDVRRCGFIR